jgi:hypothetical protein
MAALARKPRRLRIPPSLFTRVCQILLDLDDNAIDRFWTALSASPWENCAAMVRLFQLRSEIHPASIDGWRVVICQQLPPKRLIDALEALVQQALLPRLEATSIEERILARCDQHGQWD